MVTSETLPVTTGKERPLVRIVASTAASLSKATLTANPWSSNPRSRPMPPVNSEMDCRLCHCSRLLPSIICCAARASDLNRRDLKHPH